MDLEVREGVRGICVLGGLIVLLLAPQATFSQGGDGDGPPAWTPGTSWSYEGANGTLHLEVDQFRTLSAPGASYETVMTRSVARDNDGDLVFHVVAWEREGMRRVYDEVHVYKVGLPATLITTYYDPPVPYPYWAGMAPGATSALAIHTFTATMHGNQRGPDIERDWAWAAVANATTTTLDTPAGDFDGYNITVAMRRTDNGATQANTFFYAPAALNYVARWSIEGELLSELTELVLDPPPVPSVLITPPIPVVGEEIVLDASRSADPAHDNITSFTWTLPDGSTRDGPVVRMTFDEPGRVTFRLEVVDEHDQAARTPVVFDVIARKATASIEGPDAMLQGTSAAYRLVPPSGVTLRRASWEVPGAEPLSGEQVQLSFQSPGNQTVVAAFVAEDGTTGRVTKTVAVAGIAMGGAGGPDGADGLAAGLDVAPGIVSPEDGARIEGGDVLVVARITGLSEPALVLGNGLRVPLDPAEGLVTARVPVAGGTSTLTLVDGEHTVHGIILHSDRPAGRTDGPAQASEENTPWPAAGAVVALVLSAATFRRRSR